jgi:nucleoside 2-deoxyribosyltransferase
MRIYLGCTVRGDRSTLDTVRHIASRLTAAGHEILTTHLLQDDVEGAERARTDQDIYARDLAWVEACDILVAEASGSSYGVGYEVGYLLGRSPHSGQRAYVFYRRARHDAISRLISGLHHPHARVYPYDTIADVDAAVQEILASAPRRG